MDGHVCPMCRKKRGAKHFWKYVCMRSYLTLSVYISTPWPATAVFVNAQSKPFCYWTQRAERLHILIDINVHIFILNMYFWWVTNCMLPQRQRYDRVYIQPLNKKQIARDAYLYFIHLLISLGSGVLFVVRELSVLFWITRDVQMFCWSTHTTKNNLNIQLILRTSSYNIEYTWGSYGFLCLFDPHT